MTQNAPMEIPLSKNKIYLSLFGCIIFVALGIWLLIRPISNDHFLFGNPVFVKIIGVVSILFFGYIGFFLSRKVSDKKPGLIISTEGITDNSSAVAAGFIPWTDITGIKTTAVMNQKFILFIVKNPETYINKQTGIIKRKAIQMNYSTYGSPICISSNALAINFEELYNISKNKLEEQTKKTP